jgi:hypothetical protein
MGGRVTNGMSKRVQQVFSPGDQVLTKKRAAFVLDEIGEERIRFRLLASGRKMSLKQSRLAHVIDNFEDIQKKSNLELAIREVLERFGDTDTVNEPYLYGLAQEFRKRQLHLIPTTVEETLDKASEKALEEGAFDPHNGRDARERIEALIVKRRGQPEFRKKLLKAYNNRCAISGCDCPEALEAAHIQAYNGSHTNHINNGILLRCDIHTLFDLRKISINPDYTVSVCDNLQSSVYKEFHEKRLTLPIEKKDWPKVLG